MFWKKRPTDAAADPASVELGEPPLLDPGLPGPVEIDLSEPPAGAAEDRSTETSAPSAPLPDPSEAEPAAVAPPPPAQPKGARELVRARGKKLNLVDNRTLLPSIQEAALLALDRHLPGLDDGVRRAVATDARQILIELLKNRARQIRGLPEKAFLKKVKESRDRILEERRRAEAELAKLLGDLGAKRQEMLVREEMLAQETRASNALHDKVILEQIQGAFAEAGIGENHELLQQVTSVLMASVEAEREKVVQAKMSEHQKEVAHFERRIAKLSQSLQLSEQEIARLAQMKDVELGVASIFRSVQGLDAQDTDFERKKELMADIFQANLELQEAIEKALPGD